MEDIQYASANKEMYDTFSDFFYNIQNIKDKNGKLIAPDDLRKAAAELQTELKGNYTQIVQSAINKFGVTAAISNVELYGLIKNGLLSEITAGFEIASFIGNVGLDMGSLVKVVTSGKGIIYDRQIKVQV